VSRRGEADFVADITAPLPVQVIDDLVGAPPEDRPILSALTNRLAGIGVMRSLFRLHSGADTCTRTRACAQRDCHVPNQPLVVDLDTERHARACLAVTERKALCEEAHLA